MVAIALLGGQLAMLVDPDSLGWSGVAAGFVLLGFSAAPALGVRSERNGRAN